MAKVFLAVTGMLSILAAVVAVCFILSWPVMALWNGCLVDAVTGVKEITWLQGWGIAVLFGILVKSSK